MFSVHIIYCTYLLNTLTQIFVHTAQINIYLYIMSYSNYLIVWQLLKCREWGDTELGHMETNEFEDKANASFLYKRD